MLRNETEGAFKLKRTLSLLLMAIAATGLMTLPAAGQVNPEAAPGPSPAAPLKYEAFAGAAYSRLRQVPVSFSGLIGGKASLARDWGRYFQLIGSVDYYRVGTGHSGIPNPGNPSVYSILVGPGLHATLYGNLSGQFFGELGVEHTGGVNMSPDISFAGGFGGGLAYNLQHNFALQLTGDRVGASFPLPNPTNPNTTPNLGYSTHRTWNARVTFGVAYHF